MFQHNFYSRRFLESVYGTEPFVEYCATNGIKFSQRANGEMDDADEEQWTAALAKLAPENALRIQTELAKVNDLSKREGLYHLIETAQGGDLPPPSIPHGASLALWFLLHRRELFDEAFIQKEIEDQETWRNALAEPDIKIKDVRRVCLTLGEELKEFFKIRENTGRFCVVEHYPFRESHCFLAHVANRIQIIEGFTDDGKHKPYRLVPAQQVAFVYYPKEGTVSLKARYRSDDAIHSLFSTFGRAVLGIDIPRANMGFSFDLNGLKQFFRPLADGEDMEMIRLKALEFSYPPEEGRRRVKLETLASDEPNAIHGLLRVHFSDPQILRRANVCHAEIQIRMKVDGGKIKSYFIKLWPNRCSLNQTDLHERFRACLKKWGIYHAPRL